MSGIVVHHIGNKNDDQGIILSEQEVEVNESIRTVLAGYFTKPFKGQEYYSFYHDAELHLNEVYTYAKTIFQDVNALLSGKWYLSKLDSLLD